MAGLIFEEEDMILSREYSRAAVTFRVYLLVVHWQNRNGRDRRVWRKKSVDVQYGPERNIPQIRRRPLVMGDAVGEHGKGVRIVSEELSFSLNADATTTVCMIHEDKFAAIGVRLFERREFPRLGAEGFVLGDCCVRTENQEESEAERP